MVSGSPCFSGFPAHTLVVVTTQQSSFLFVTSQWPAGESIIDQGRVRCGTTILTLLGGEADASDQQNEPQLGLKDQQVLDVKSYASLFSKSIETLRVHLAEKGDGAELIWDKVCFEMCQSLTYLTHGSCAVRGWQLGVLLALFECFPLRLCIRI